MNAQLCTIKCKVLDIIMAQIDHLEDVNVCDIVKDIAETEYYLSVVASMDKSHIDAAHMASAHEILSLTDYLHSLTDKVNTMIQGATPEEKAMMKDKLRELYQLL